MHIANLTSQGIKGLLKLKNNKQQQIKGSGYLVKSISPPDSKLMALANEVTKSKDETIAAKNYAIQLLETMLQHSQKTL